MTFVNITQEATIRIFNMAGELVTSFDNESAANQITWDLTNSNGNFLTPGVYVYMITDWMQGSSRAVGKLAVIP